MKYLLIIILFTTIITSCKSNKINEEPLEIASKLISCLDGEIKNTTSDDFMDFNSKAFFIKLKPIYTRQSFKEKIADCKSEYGNITTEENWTMEMDGESIKRMYYIDNIYYLRISFHEQGNTASISVTYN